MGLDMTIYGRRSFVGAPIPAEEQHPQYGEARVALATKAGLVDEPELAYWRKHANLHGYIVQTFAGGVDECQEIPLDADKLKQLLDATQGDGTLPETQGFFFGVSNGQEKEGDKILLTEVIEWLAATDDDPAVVRTVFYQASW